MALRENLKKLGRGMVDYAGDYIWDHAELANLLIGTGTAYNFVAEASKGNGTASFAFILVTATAVGSASAIQYCKNKVQ